MNNATWEDWEAWYEKFRPEPRHRHKQKPVFLSNGAFVSLIALLAALGGVGQATRVEANTKTILQLREERHERASAEFKKVRESARGFTREERVLNFLRMRDPAAYAHPGLRSMMLDMDVCGPGQGRAGGVRNKDADFRRSYRDTGQGKHPLQHRVDDNAAR